MPPRRSHKKSRAGCRRCKARKVKCDEVHPRCTNCVKHAVECDFENPAVIEELTAAPTPNSGPQSPASAQAANPAASVAASLLPDGLQSSSLGLGGGGSGGSSRGRLPALLPLLKTPGTVIPTGLSGSQANGVGSGMGSGGGGGGGSGAPAPISRMLELRLMHNYTSFTSRTLTPSRSSSEVWQLDVPRLAFGGATYLADAVLAVSALHLRSRAPHDRALVQASHAYMASSLVAYRDALCAGFDQASSEALFLTATLIAFQSMATRVFAGHDEGVVVAAAAAMPEHNSPRPQQQHQHHHQQARHSNGGVERATTTPGASGRRRGSTTNNNTRANYTAPLSCFHAFQGVKALVVSSWHLIRTSNSVLSIIDSQAPMHLDDMLGVGPSFFGALLEGLEEEEEESGWEDGTKRDRMNGNDAGQWGGDEAAAAAATAAAASRETADSYRHAVSVLEWAHRSPQPEAALLFPASVARRYINLLAEGRPRALAILAAFFALLRRVDNFWWVSGLPRREVMAIAAHFDEVVAASTSLASSSSAIAASASALASGSNMTTTSGRGTEEDEEVQDEGEESRAAKRRSAEFARWRPHLQWPLSIVNTDLPIPPEVWGAESGQRDGSYQWPSRQSFVEHIDLVAQMMMQDPRGIGGPPSSPLPNGCSANPVAPCLSNGL